MTRDHILGEPAGRQVDEWVAEHVIGWKPCDFLRDFNGSVWPQDVPEYSSRLMSAWDVVVHMQANGWNFSVESGDLGEYAAEFVCWHGPCERHGNPHDDYHAENATAPTAQLAICRAALLTTLRDFPQIEAVRPFSRE